MVQGLKVLINGPWSKVLVNNRKQKVYKRIWQIYILFCNIKNQIHRGVFYWERLIKAVAKSNFMEK